MARGCSVCTLFSLNLALLLVGIALIAAPLVGCSEFCHLRAAEIESLRIVVVLQAVGGFLVLFSLLGCCLAASGKKRYRFPYLLVLLLAVVVGGVVVAADRGLLFKPLATYDPAAPAKVKDAIDGLATAGMKSFYHDFAGVYQAADCQVKAGPAHVTCEDCQPLEAAFSTCMADWQHSPEADRYLKECTTKLTSTEAHCDGECTLAFCQCASVLESTVEDYAKYVKYGLLGVGALLVFLLVAGICVSRKPERVAQEQPGQILLLQPLDQPRRQPVLV